MEQNNNAPRQETGFYSVPGSAETVHVSVPRDPELPLTWRDAAAPLLALVLSALFWAAFSLEDMLAYGPGLGVLVFTAAYYAAVFLMLGRRFDRRGLPFAAVSLLLALCCAMYAHIGIMVLNCFLILILSAMATFALSGQGRFSPLDIRAIPETVRLSAAALFTRVDRPFRAAGRFRKSDVLGRTVLAVLVTVLLLAVVLALLSSADMVFGSFFTGLRDRLRELSFGSLVWKTFRFIVLALFITSGFFFLREPVAGASPKSSGKTRHILPFLLPAAALDLVYIVFCIVQIRFLFGGAEAAAMAGGWAEYARTGFFQLAAVACINLLLCLLGTDEARFAEKGAPTLRITDGVMLVLTAVILVSACYRMHLYIAAFGLSVLRLMTLWGMLVILAGLLLAGWKLIRPEFSFWRVFFPFALGTWCLLCLMNPAGRIADYNVNAYLDGRLAETDVSYLQDLSPDAAPALKRLEEESDEYDAAVRRVMSSFRSEIEDARDDWTSWKFSFRKAD